jgi:hypothetical protein
MDEYIEYISGVEYRGNKVFCILRCEVCHKQWSEILENSYSDCVEDSFTSWVKPIIEKHDLEHKNKVRVHG